MVGFNDWILYLLNISEKKKKKYYNRLKLLFYFIIYLNNFINFLLKSIIITQIIFISLLNI